MWFRKLKLLEEAIRHILVVMLSGMNKAKVDVFAFGLGFMNGVDDRRDFHEVGTGAGYKIDIHVLIMLYQFHNIFQFCFP